MRNTAAILMVIVILMIKNGVLSAQLNIDGDNDYISDKVEQELAIKFRPLLYIDPGDLNYLYPEMGYNVPFSIEPFADNSNALCVVITYGFIFYMDTGVINGHLGDPEFCRIICQKKEQYTDQEAFNNSDAWELIGRVGYGHLGTVCESEDEAFSSTETIPPIFWVGKDKHAFYTDSDECGWPCDNCDYTPLPYYDYQSYLQNIGSNSSASGFYINKFIYDIIQNKWVNIWELKDFPGVAHYMDRGKFNAIPNFVNYSTLKVYQPDGNYSVGNNTHGTFSSPMPFAVITSNTCQNTYVTLNERDANVYFEIRTQVHGTLIKKIIAGRLKKGQNLIRLWDYTPSGEFQNDNYLITGYIYTTELYDPIATDVTRLIGINNVVPLPIVPSVDSVISTSPYAVKIYFDRPMSLSSKSIKIFNGTEWSANLEVFPPTELFANEFQQHYDLTVENPLDETSNFLKLNKQEIFSAQGVVIYDYSENPYLIIPILQRYSLSEAFVDYFDSSLDFGKWSLTGNGNVTVSNSEAHINLGSGIKSKTDFSSSSTYEARQKHAAESGYQWHGLKFTDPATGELASIYTQAGALHTQVYTNGQCHDVNLGLGPGTSFHLYKIQWEPGQTNFYYDQELVHTEPYALSNNSNIAAETPSDAGTGVMDVDWVTVSSGEGMPRPVAFLAAHTPGPRTYLDKITRNKIKIIS